jgi:ABC-type Fe3+/spermidine/putrescine transport system ATPase subunit
MVSGWTVRGLVVRAGGFRTGPVDLDLPPDTAIAVVGRSGAGKTTLLRGLAGLAPVEAGTVFRGGEDVTGSPPEARRVGYVPQGLGLLPHRTVEANIGYPLQLRGLPASPVVDPLLDRFGLGKLAHRRPDRLSTGEQQRVAMARALAADPELLIWDEPLAGLDLVARDDLLLALADVRRRERLPLLIVTHDPSVAFTIADRVLVLEAGEVVHSGPVLGVADRPVDSFVARFVGFENVFSLDDLSGSSPSSVRGWLSARAGPGGVAFRASGVRLPPTDRTTAFSGQVRRVAPGPDGFTLLVDADGLLLRARWVPRGPDDLPPTEVLFDLDPMATRAIPRRPLEVRAG